MNTRVVKINPENIDYNILNEAAHVIQNGGTVIFPTETVYGLGADALNEDACNKIFEAKGRPKDNPLIVHITCMDDLNKIVADIPEKARILADKFWPGPLTMIFKRKPIISDTVTCGLETVAVRMPNNKVALELIRLSKTSIAAPSANTSGKPSPTQAQHVIDDMDGKVDMIIDGGNCNIGLESTVVDMTLETPMILRPGKVTREDIDKIFGKCDYDPAIIKSDAKIIPKSPGQKYRHYAPKAKVITYKGNLSKVVDTINKAARLYIEQGKSVGIMATDQTQNLYNQGIICSIGDRLKPITIASNLFGQLRSFDKMNVDIILAEAVDDKELGKAIMNRLEKASSEIVNLKNLKLLLICTGNTCRSIMAQGIIEDMVKDKKLSIDVISAGINAIEGECPTKNAVDVMNDMNIDISSHKAKLLTKKMIDEADLIITMTEAHKKSIQKYLDNHKGKLFTLKEFANDENINDSLDIQDPYGGNYNDYKNCLDEISKYAISAINKIIKMNGLSKREEIKEELKNNSSLNFKRR